MSKWQITVVLVTTLLAGACGDRAEMDVGSRLPVADQLKQADRDFAAETADRGLDGWMAYFADDAARPVFGGKVTRGRSDIRAADSLMFTDPTVRLVWDPTHAGAFRDDDHGYTMGRYQVVKLEEGSPRDTLSEGFYLSIWRRDTDGWRVILDTGVSDPD
jgi:ketosteroid isomerase-like protein